MPRSIPRCFTGIAPALLLALSACTSTDDAPEDTPGETPEETPEETPDPSPAPELCTGAYEGPEPQVVQEGRFEYLQEFPSSLLGNTRTIRIFLPASYGTTSDRTYPVLYMHDGQNLFDASTAAFGVEWQVDETLDAGVTDGTLSEVLVVGIDNTDDRISEYTPTVDASYGGGDGDLYARFILEELRPYIETHYTTRCGPSNTAVMGSSLGGLISFYMGWTYPEAFGMAAAVSPSFWWNDGDTLALLEAFTGAPPAVRFWVDAGTAEGEDDDGDGLTYVVEDVRAVRDQLLELDYVFERTLGYQEQYGAGHNETAWASRLGNPLRFFFGIDLEPAVTGLELLPYGSLLGLTGTTSSQLEVNSQYGNGLEMTVPNQLASLTSRNPDIAQVSAAGVIIAVAVGSTTLEAAWNTRTASASIEVVPDLSTTVALTFAVTVPASTPTEDTIYIVGSIPELAEWDPAAVPLTRVDDLHWSLTLQLARGTGFEYKYTRGSWETVEKDASGTELGNRTEVAAETGTLNDTVERWADE